MVILFTIIHILVCVILIGVVLLQSGKAADLAGAFGGMGSQTTFGPRGAATMLSKVTSGAAILFMVTSLSLAVLSTRNAATSSSGSVLERTKVPAPAATPASPGGVQVSPAKPSAGPQVELLDEAGRPVKKYEVELPKDGKDGKVKIGKELPLNGNAPGPVPAPAAPKK